ncbi:MAG: hypothetical protein OXC12_11635 [Spirochaetaceae bacterium]|nr:hypothetical protein [Spirochaetaceae bacterium]
MELHNALRFKVFIDELAEQEVDGLLATYRTRRVPVGQARLTL